MIENCVDIAAGNQKPIVVMNPESGVNATGRNESSYADCNTEHQRFSLQLADVFRDRVVAVRNSCGFQLLEGFSGGGCLVQFELYFGQRTGPWGPGVVARWCCQCCGASSQRFVVRAHSARASIW